MGCELSRRGIRGSGMRGREGERREGGRHTFWTLGLRSWWGVVHWWRAGCVWGGHGGVVVATICGGWFE